MRKKLNLLHSASEVTICQYSKTKVNNSKVSFGKTTVVPVMFDSPPPQSTALLVCNWLKSLDQQSNVPHQMQP